jgi:DNA invertase Pin-like site-specific DNA recombinase
MTFDGATKDPIQRAVRDALIGFMAATAQAQAEATKAAQQAGIDLAKEMAVYLGRKPSYNREQLSTVTTMLANQASISEIAKLTKLSRPVIYRIKDAPAAAEASLVKWEARPA